MAEPILKFPLEGRPPIQSTTQRLVTAARARLRLILLVIAPALVLVAGLAVYLMGGRYVSTDNAFVGAQKVLITPDISGKINRAMVREGQHVDVGDVLFEIDPEPFRLALQQAQSNLSQARTTYNNLRSNYQSYTRMLDLAHQGIELKQRDVERKATLVRGNVGSQLDLDTTTTNLVVARTQLELLEQQLASARNQLQGDPDLPLAQFPPYAQADAALGEAQRNLAHTTLRAPISGTATQVDNIQLGRFVAAGTPVFSIIDDQHPWVDANPKETDLTYVQVGQKVTMEVDAFPSHTFLGTVTSLSPGTGAQFAILPPQNASGNWIKVVQRVPLRITFDADEQTGKLKAGMSVTISIDTGHRRTLATLFGFGEPPTGPRKDKPR
ncbi:MAG: HlyD family secretion protein [Xanthobacteraceae bacterium]|nr:MAG: HlyD family secretion protein [Xanthobacteraceae bacterium]